MKVVDEIAEVLDENACLRSYSQREEWLAMMSAVKEIIAAKLEPARELATQISEIAQQGDGTVIAGDVSRRLGLAGVAACAILALFEEESV